MESNKPRTITNNSLDILLERLEKVSKDDGSSESASNIAYLKACELAMTLCNLFPLEEADVPEVCLGDERGITIYWENKNIFCEVEPEGTFSIDQVAFHDPKGPTHHHQTDFGEGPPAEVATHIAMLLSA